MLVDTQQFGSLEHLHEEHLPASAKIHALQVAQVSSAPVGDYGNSETFLDILIE